MSDRTEKITLQMIYKKHTPDALLIEDDIGLSGVVWLPLSQIEVDLDGLEMGDQVEVTMPNWLARERDLV